MSITLLLLAVASFSPRYSFAVDAPIALVYSSCSSINYSYAEYQNSLRLLLASLVERGPRTGFNTSVMVRQDSHETTLYGLVQCRGDLPKQSCKDCLSSATHQIRQVCQEAISAQVQLTGCFLRYSNSNFFHYPAVSRNVLRYKRCNRAASNNQEMLTNIQSVLLILKEVSPVQQNFRYTAIGIGATKVYGLAECQADLLLGECGTCLSRHVTEIQRSCNRTVGAAVYSDYCYLRYETYPFFYTRENGGPNGISSCGTRHSSRNKVIAISAVGAAILVAAACVSCSIIFRGLRGARIKSEANHEIRIDTGPCIFNYDCLKIATSNFAQENKLGKGGFGEVYKGVLTDGREVAVKRLWTNSNQAKREFHTEVKLSSCIQHRNLLKLLGWCVERRQRMLVYEYMKNRSLDNILFGVRDSKPFLDWPTRRNIILGVARGLAYLHEDSEVRIVHRDIKASNILIDENYVAKIGDFGLALHVKDNRHGTTNVAGTIGYIAPECTMHAKLTEKVDVFGFGVAVLEIMSGRRNKDPGLPENMKLLLEWAWRLCEEGRLLDLMDARLENDSSMSYRNQMQIFLHVALLCAQEDSHLRPSMSRVVLMLSEVIDNVGVQCLPLDRCCGGEGRVESILSLESLRRTASVQRTAASRQQHGTIVYGNNSACDASKNLMTISEIEPR